jgi:hypothetical protein
MSVVSEVISETSGETGFGLDGGRGHRSRIARRALDRGKTRESGGRRVATGR